VFSDPLAITYSGSGKSLARVAGFKPGLARTMTAQRYATPEGEFEAFVSQATMGGGLVRSELMLGRTPPDPDSPFVGRWDPWSNRVGISFEVNSPRYNTAVDIPLLRTALLTLVDTTFQSRLIAGEF
jgi:hypothetical protein